MLSQKDAVFSIISKILHDKGVKVEFGKTRVYEIFVDDYKRLAIDMLVAGFKDGSIHLTKDVLDIKVYASTLISNWLRKDSRLNGGFMYMSGRNNG